MPQSYKFMLALVLASLIRSVFAAPDYGSTIPAIREAVSQFSSEHLAEQSGTINGKKYLATILNEDSIVVAIITPSGSYEPIAMANLGDLPYPSVSLKNGLVVIHAGYAHHGVYDTEYKFRLKNGAFYLTEIRDFANFSDDYHDPSIQIMTLTVADFEKFRVDYWKKRFTIYKNNEEYKPGFRAWSHAMDRVNRDFMLPLPSNISTNLPKQSFELEGFKFEDVSNSINRVISRRKKAK